MFGKINTSLFLIFWNCICIHFFKRFVIPSVWPTLLSCFGFVSVLSASKIVPCGLWLVPSVQDREQPKHSLGSGVVFWSAWPLPLITRELPNCRVTAMLLHLASGFRHILGVSVGSFRVSCNSSFSKTRGWAVEMPFQGNEGACRAGDGTLYRGRSLPAAFAWLLGRWQCRISAERC